MVEYLCHRFGLFGLTMLTEHKHCSPWVRVILFLIYAFAAFISSRRALIP